MFKIAEKIYKYCISNKIRQFSYVDYNPQYNQDIEYGFNLNWYNDNKTKQSIYEIIRYKHFRYFKSKKLQHFNRVLKIKKITNEV